MDWNKDTIKTWLKSVNPEMPEHRAAIGRALVLIYNRQTSDEQASNCTSHNNGRGFNGTDADFGSSVAQKFIKWGNLTPNQCRAVAKMLCKYAGQLAEEKQKQGQLALSATAGA